MSRLSKLTSEQMDVEYRVRTLLRGVGFVFESGFPKDLTDGAFSIVETAAFHGLLMGRDRVLVPGCVVLRTVALACEYDGQSLWQNPKVVLPGLDERQLPIVVMKSLKQLQLDTFEEIVEAEKGLRRLTPVLMHAGIPAANLADLVRLIASANRQHILGAEEQIAWWSRTPHGFNGLWRAPERFLRHGGAAAVDLLDRLNEALQAPNSEHGLPDHLLAALGSMENSLAPQFGEGKRVLRERPKIFIDPWSCTGPQLRLPALNTDVINRWRLAGASRLEVPMRITETIVPLEPSREWSVQGLGSGGVAARWQFPAHGRLPVIFFDRRSGLLLRHRAALRDATSESVIALVHPQVEVEGLEPTEQELPNPVGRWSGWRLVEYKVPRRAEVRCNERGNPSDVETLHLVPTRRRPELSAELVVGRCRTAAGLEVHSGVPDLEVSLGSVRPGDVHVEIDHSGWDRPRRCSLDELGVGPRFPLAAMFDQDGLYGVAVHGPLGLRLPRREIAVVAGLAVATNPRVASFSDAVSVVVSSDRSDPVHASADPGATHVSTAVGDVSLTLEIPRVRWSLRSIGQSTNELGFTPVQLAVDELTPLDPPLLSFDTGVDVPSSLQLLAEGNVLATVDPPRQTNRWTASLDRLKDTVEHAGLESLDLALMIDGRRIGVGRITATYVPSILEVRCDPVVEPAVVEFRVAENRPFKSRVVRVWDLDRPWEASQSIVVAESQRDNVHVFFPADHRASRFRLWLRVEDPWAPEPQIPTAATPGVVDLDVRCGRLLDLNTPEDRVVGSLRGTSGCSMAPEDFWSHGHLVVAMLSAGQAREGSGWFTTSQAGRVLNLLEEQPHSLPTSIANALLLGLISPASAYGVSLAALPTLLGLEREVDLSLPPEVAEQMWTTMPLAAASIESWSDSVDSVSRWALHLGWPRLRSDEASDEDVSIEFDHMPLLDKSMQFQFRLAVGNTALFEAIRRETLSDQPLTVDFRLRGIMEAFQVPEPGPYTDWLVRYSAIVSEAHRSAARSPFAAWVKSLSLGDSASTRWMLTDIAALAVSLVATHGNLAVIHQALIDGASFASSWVLYCVAQMLAFDAGRHTGPLRSAEPSGDSE